MKYKKYLADNESKEREWKYKLKTQVNEMSEQARIERENTRKSFASLTETKLKKSGKNVSKSLVEDEMEDKLDKLKSIENNLDDFEADEETKMGLMFIILIHELVDTASILGFIAEGDKNLFSYYPLLMKLKYTTDFSQLTQDDLDKIILAMQEDFGLSFLMEKIGMNTIHINLNENEKKKSNPWNEIVEAWKERLDTYNKRKGKYYGKS